MSCTVVAAAEDRFDGEQRRDHEGSAKVALLGIDRSIAAWRAAIERGLTTATEAYPLIRDLVRLRTDIEEVFPKARAFQRPGFDEPDVLAKLQAANGP